MIKNAASPLHLEWTPQWVRVKNVATGVIGEAGRLHDLAPLLAGHWQALVGIGRSRVFLKTIRLPKASPSDLRRILAVQMSQMFPLPAAELSFDFFQTMDQTPEGCLTVVGAVRSADLRALREDLQEAGLTASRILPVALAAPAVALRAGARDALVAERDRGGLMLDVVTGGVLRFSRVAPEDSDLEIEARRMLTAARAGDAPVVAVGALALPGAPGSGCDTLECLHETPPFHLVLAEEREREARLRSAARTRLAALMMVSALLLVLLVWVDRESALAVVKRGQGAWAREFVIERSILAAASEDADQADMVRDVLHTALVPAQPLSDVSAVVTSAVPPGAWLTGMTAERGKPLEIRGTAKTSGDVARLVYALSSSPRFRDVKLVFANSASIGKTPVIEFNVSAHCVGNAAMPAPAQPDVESAENQ